MEIKKKRKIVWSDLIFYIIILSIPLVKYLFGIIFINSGSIVLAFERWNEKTSAMEFVGFQNFRDVWELFTTNELISSALGRSLKAYVLAVAVTTLIPIFFSFYVYKKFFGAEFFKVVLFIPSIVSSIITMTIFRFLANRGIPQLIMSWFDIEIMGLTNNPDTAFNTILFYSLWLSLGGSLLVNIGAMNAIDKSSIEAGYMDGMNLFQEFWHITLPSIYRITCLGFITGIASVFTADYGLYGFYGNAADPHNWTIGYYFTVNTIDATEAGIPFYSAWGVMISLVTIPITLLARKLIYTYGPSED